MRPRRPRLVAACIAALAVVFSPMATGRAASAGVSPFGAAPVGSVPDQTVMLITGDTVTVHQDPSGRIGTTVTPAAPGGPGAEFQTYLLHGDVFVVPETAVAYLDRPLDPALFDVTALARAQADASDATAVQVSFHAGATARVLPGLSAANTDSQVTPADARDFGAALTRQWLSDVSRGQLSTNSALFAGVASIAPAGAAAGNAGVVRAGNADAASAGPAANMFTLTVNGIDALGQPDIVDRFELINVDDSRKYLAFTSWQNGVAKVSVPAGNYSITAFFFRPVAANAFKAQLVTIPEFRVGKDLTITLDARTATSELAVTTPLPTNFASSEMTVIRTPRTGSTVGTFGVPGGVAFFTFINNLNINTMYARPTVAAPQQGTLTYDSFWRRPSPAGGPAYTYDLEYPAFGTIPADQAHVVSNDQLATLDTTYHGPPQGRPESEARLSYLPGQPISARSTNFLTAPLQRTEYVSADPAVAWQHVADGFGAFAQNPLDRMDDGYHTYVPGQHETVNWMGDPIRPDSAVDFGVNPAAFPFACPACRVDNTMALDIEPFGDTQPGHVGYADNPGVAGETRSATLYEDGTPIASGTDPVGVVPVASHPATYQLVYDVARTSAIFPLSVQTQTEWTFHSQPAAPSEKSNAPASWVCPGATTHSVCTVLPLLQLDYQMPVDAVGGLSAGPTRITLTVAHQQASAAAPVISASMSVSFDDGTTWTPATVSTQPDGSYAVDFTVPPAAQTDGYGSLRTVATDAAGGQISQTIIRAFAVNS